MAPPPTRIFVSYAREDRPFLDAFVKHLKPLQREGAAVFWSDVQLAPGDDWARTIDDRLRTADVIVLLVSPDSLQSDFCYEVEGQFAVKRHRDGEARAVPVILRACDWKNTMFGALQVVPRDGAPISSFDDQDAAWLQVVEALRGVVSREAPAATTARDEASERRYLEWIKGDLLASLKLWHESPIVPLQAHRKKKRPRLFRHDPEDYAKNPALSDLELSVRAGFGRRVKIKDLARELRKHTNMVVLGDPGSGKSVCLRQLAHDLAEIALRRSGAPESIPLFIDMGAYDQNEPTGEPLNILAFLKQYLVDLESVRDAGDNHPVTRLVARLHALLLEGRVTCIFDALDEMPQQSYRERYDALTRFIQAWQPLGNRFVFSCRTLDYDPSFPVDEVIIDPFDRHRIRRFLDEHVPDVADVLYARIVDDESLEEIVSNPFFLQAFAYINLPAGTTDDGQSRIRVPGTRGELIRVFCEELIMREYQRRSTFDHERLRTFLGEIAFTMQERGEGGTAIPRSLVDDVVGRYPDASELFWVATRARLLGKRGEQADERADAEPPAVTLPDTVQFVHHRLQEYFAAVELAARLSPDAERAKAVGADVEAVLQRIDAYLEDIWWHETVVMAVGIVDDPQPLLARMFARRPDVAAWGDRVLREFTALERS